MSLFNIVETTNCDRFITLEGWYKKDRYNDESQGINDYLENSFDNILDSPNSSNKNVLANLFDNLNKPFGNSPKSTNKDFRQNVLSQNSGKLKLRKKQVESFVEENNEKELSHLPSLTNYISFNKRLPNLSSIKERTGFKVEINEGSPRNMKSLKRRQAPEIKERNGTKALPNLEITNNKNRSCTPDSNPLDLIQASLTDELRHSNTNANSNNKSLNINYSKHFLAGRYKLPKIQHQQLINNDVDEISKETEEISLNKINHKNIYISKMKNFSPSRKLKQTYKSKELIQKNSNNNFSFNNIIRNINNINVSTSSNIDIFKEEKSTKNNKNSYLLYNLKEIDNIRQEISHRFRPYQHALINKEETPHDESTYQIEENSIKSTISMPHFSVFSNNQLSKSPEQTKDTLKEKIKYSSRSKRSSMDGKLNLYEKDRTKFLKLYEKLKQNDEKVLNSEVIIN